MSRRLESLYARLERVNKSLCAAGTKGEEEHSTIVKELVRLEYEQGGPVEIPVRAKYTCTVPFKKAN